MHSYNKTHERIHKYTHNVYIIYNSKQINNTIEKPMALTLYNVNTGFNVPRDNV